jgi:hypothetical protein
VSKDTSPPRRSQILFPLDELRRSPIWRQQQEAIARLREKLLTPYTEEQLARLRTLGLSIDADLSSELVEVLRQRREQQNAPESGPEPAEPEPTLTVESEAEPELAQSLPAEAELPSSPAGPGPTELETQPPPVEFEPAVGLEAQSPAQFEPVELEAHGRPRHAFPHLDEALAGLWVAEERTPALQDNERRQALFVIKTLRRLGDKVDEGKQLKTIARRIKEERARRQGRTKPR